MRSDMAKVIVERPRHGSINYSMAVRPKLRHQFDEDAPTSMPMGGSRVYTDHKKSHTDHLNPLIRFIESRVGQPWDDVYSEICEHVRLDSTVQRHLLTHLDWLVEQHVVMVDGVPYDLDGSKLTHSGTSTYQKYYVNPETGRLAKSPWEMSWRRRNRRDKPAKNFIPTDDPMVEYRCQDGIWYEVRFETWTPMLPMHYDFLTKETVPAWVLRDRYGNNRRPAQKRQLSKREIRRLGLRENQN